MVKFLTGFFIHINNTTYKHIILSVSTWFMPALANSSVGSSSGIVDDEWTYSCCFSWIKKSINDLRISLAVRKVFMISASKIWNRIRYKDYCLVESDVVCVWSGSWWTMLCRNLLQLPTCTLNMLAAVSSKTFQTSYQDYRTWDQWRAVFLVNPLRITNITILIFKTNIYTLKSGSRKMCCKVQSFWVQHVHIYIFLRSLYTYLFGAMSFWFGNRLKIWKFGHYCHMGHPDDHEPSEKGDI